MQISPECSGTSSMPDSQNATIDRAVSVARIVTSRWPNVGVWPRASGYSSRTTSPAANGC